MAGFLDSFGSSTGTDIYVAISSSGKIEAATLDQGGHFINSYAFDQIEYNESLRELASYQELRSKLTSLMKECNVAPSKTNVHLSIPTVWFGYKENIPNMLDDPAINDIAIGELEQTYIFKRKDPIPFWFDAMTSTNAGTRSIFYTAIQEDAKSAIQKAVKDAGANLVSLDCSIFSDLRALSATGIASEQMDAPGYSWSLMIVNNAGFQLFGMQNKKILEYYEEPIAIKSYEGDEIYSAIDNSAQVALLSSASNALVIVSETDLVSAEILAKGIQFTGQIISVEDNKFKKAPLTDLGFDIIKENQIQVSLHILGLVADKDILPVELNFLAAAGEKLPKTTSVIEIKISEDKSIVITPQQATIYTLILAVLLGVILWLGMFIPSSFNDNYKNQTEQLNTQLNQINEELKKYENSSGTSTFNADKEIETVLKNNRVKIMAYTALGESIPKGLYLTYFMTGDNGYVDIQGCANSVEDVYVFFQNLKDSLIESKLRLNKLDLRGDSLDNVINASASAIDEAPYVFEITNMDDSQLQSFMGALNGVTPEQAEQKGEQPTN